jgi:hypothetical protein
MLTMRAAVCCAVLVLFLWTGCSSAPESELEPAPTRWTSKASSDSLSFLVLGDLAGRLPSATEISQIDTALTRIELRALGEFDYTPARARMSPWFALVRDAGRADTLPTTRLISVTMLEHSAQLLVHRPLGVDWSILQASAYADIRSVDPQSEPLQGPFIYYEYMGHRVHAVFSFGGAYFAAIDGTLFEFAPTDRLLEMLAPFGKLVPDVSARRPIVRPLEPDAGAHASREATGG